MKELESFQKLSRDTELTAEHIVMLQVLKVLLIVCLEEQKKPGELLKKSRLTASGIL